MRPHRRVGVVTAALVTAALALGSVAATAEVAQASTVTVTPTEYTGLLTNPGKGWLLYDGAQNNVASVRARTSTVYNRFNWIDLEPTEGVYNWTILDHLFDTYVPYGMRVGIGIMAENTCDTRRYITPQWVFTDGAASTTGTVADCVGNFTRTTPVWNDPIFLQKYKDMLIAVRDRYENTGNLAFIQNLAYGNWGELGTNDYFQGSVPITEAEFQTKYLQMFLDVFSKTPIIAIANGRFDNALNWGVQQGIGISRNGIPSVTDGSEITRTYGLAPGEIEWAVCWQGAHWNTALLANADTVSKASYENLGCWDNDGLAFLTDQQAYIDAENNKLGYHFVLTSATLPNAITNGTSYSTSLTWNNKGNTYSYEPMRTAYALLDASNNVVAKYFPDSGSNLQRLAPGTTTETANLQFGGVAAGTYKLAIGVFKNTTDANPTYKLAITGGTANNWYPLISSVTVSGSGTPAVYPQTYEAEFQTPTFTTGKHVVHQRVATAGSGMVDRFQGTATGQAVTYPLTITQTGTMDVKVRYQKNVVGGNFQLSVDGVNVGSPIFTYASSNQLAEVDLGNITLSTTGVHTFKFTNVGTSVSDYTLTLDNILIGSSGTTPPPPTGGTIVDDLNDWTKTVSHTGNLTFDTQFASDYAGDGSRAARFTSTNEEIVWQNTGTTSFGATAYFHNSEAVSEFSFYTSSNGTTWTQVTPTVVNGTSGVWTKHTYSLSGLTGVNYLKVRWNNTSGVNWNPQLGQVTLTDSSTPPPGGGGGTATVYEAESGTFAGGAQNQTASNASAGHAVGNINAVGASVQIGSVDGGSTAGNGTVVIRYANGNVDNRSLSLYVNGVKIQQVVFTPSGGWNTFADTAAITIPLTSGTTNTVKLQRDSTDTASADIDKFTVTPGSGSGSGGGGGGAGSLTGTAFGTSGTWAPPADTFDKVFDGNTATYFDSTTATGAYAGIDLGSGVAKHVTSITFCPRSGYEIRMVGGKFQGSNTSSSSGFVDLYTVATQPASGCTTVTVSDPTNYRYLRYVGGTNSYGNVAEVTFTGA